MRLYVWCADASPACSKRGIMASYAGSRDSSEHDAVAIAFPPSGAQMGADLSSSAGMLLFTLQHFCMQRYQRDVAECTWIAYRALGLHTVVSTRCLGRRFRAWLGQHIRCCYCYKAVMLSHVAVAVQLPANWVRDECKCGSADNHHARCSKCEHRWWEGEAAADCQRLRITSSVSPERFSAPPSRSRSPAYPRRRGVLSSVSLRRSVRSSRAGTAGRTRERSPEVAEAVMDSEELFWSR